MLWNQSSPIFMHTDACGTDCLYIQQQSSNNLPPPPSPFVFLPLHAFFPSAARLPPSSRLLSALATDPPERGLMRANDGNACCCFPFINGSTLAHRNTAFHHQQSAISGRLFLSLHLSPPRSVSYPSPLSSLKWSGFSPFSLNLYLSCLSLAGLSLPTTTTSSMNTNMCKFGPNYCSMSFQWADRKSLGETNTSSNTDWSLHSLWERKTAVTTSGPLELL